MTDLEEIPKKFLAGWLETLLESINKNLDEEQRKIILQETGDYCAQANASALFHQIKTQSNDIKELIKILNDRLKGTKWELTDKNKLKVVYEKCYCPIINSGMHNSSVQCDCSIGWLKKNLEILFNKDVDVELKESILRGKKQCVFEISY